MHTLLKLSGRIDALTERIGKAAIWVVLIVVLISAGNAVMRYAFSYSSNAYLEIQWYLFGLIFFSCAGYTLFYNEHVRIDVIVGNFSKRTQTWIDILGTVFFLMPVACLVLYMGIPVLIDSIKSHEMSNSEGGLIMWPARFMIVAGFFLLLMQGLSELIKRIGFLMGLCPDPTLAHKKKSAEEELAEAIRAQKGEAK